jgi:hypothetical protein
VAGDAEQRDEPGYLEGVGLDVSAFRLGAVRIYVFTVPSGLVSSTAKDLLCVGQ